MYKRKTKTQKSRVITFIKYESWSFIKLPLKTLFTSLVWFKTNIIVKIIEKIVSKFTNLKLFLINVPSINKDIIANDKKSSGNIKFIICISYLLK